MDKPCSGKCGDYMCKHGGKWVDTFDYETLKSVFKKCKELWIDWTQKWNGSCGFGQCKSKNGLCLDTSEWDEEGSEQMNGKCIKPEEKCNGTCINFQCESEDGLCIDMIVEDEQDGYEQTFLNICDGKCIMPSEKCKGECGNLQCESNYGKCVDNKITDQEECDEKCIKKGEKCTGKCVEL